MLGLQFECPSSGKNAWLTFLTFDLLINNFLFCMLCSLFLHSSVVLFTFGGT